MWGRARSGWELLTFYCTALLGRVQGTECCSAWFSADKCSAGCSTWGQKCLRDNKTPRDAVTLTPLLYTSASNLVFLFGAVQCIAVSLLAQTHSNGPDSKAYCSWRTFEGGLLCFAGIKERESEDNITFYSDQNFQQNNLNRNYINVFIQTLF